MLQEEIRLLEDKRAQQGQLLKNQFNHAFKSIKRVRLFKNTFDNMTSSPDMMSNILITTIGLTARYFSKKGFFGLSGNRLKKLPLRVLQVGISYFIIKSLGKYISKRNLSKKETNA